jgi:hypothetical protein
MVIIEGDAKLDEIPAETHNRATAAQAADGTTSQRIVVKQKEQQR